MSNKLYNPHADSEPKDVYRRHDNCGCSVTYENGRQRTFAFGKLRSFACETCGRMCGASEHGRRLSRAPVRGSRHASWKKNICRKC